MFPRMVIDNIANAAARYAKAFRQDAIFFAFFEKLPNLTNIIISQFCPIVFHALRNMSETLLERIQKIIQVCSKKQMRRVAALFVIAVVKYKQTFWDRPISIFVCKTMSVVNLTTVLHKSDFSISMPMTRSLPFPARFLISDFNSAPKWFHILYPFTMNCTTKGSVSQ